MQGVEVGALDDLGQGAAGVEQCAGAVPCAGLPGLGEELLGRVAGRGGGGLVGDGAYQGGGGVGFALDAVEAGGGLLAGGALQFGAATVVGFVGQVGVAEGAGLAQCGIQAAAQFERSVLRVCLSRWVAVLASM
ncbi:hypothetical protein [Streptomyces natalensis]|uniref:hypothetical protein n=1 Tax=Streptomyces natalensis TaxID=68242 RepID=UPI0012FF04E9|nr:hypothetical protein [Streptomyces natalensis]